MCKQSNALYSQTLFKDFNLDKIQAAKITEWEVGMNWPLRIGISAYILAQKLVISTATEIFGFI